MHHITAICGIAFGHRSSRPGPGGLLSPNWDPPTPLNRSLSWMAYTSTVLASEVLRTRTSSPNRNSSAFCLDRLQSQSGPVGAIDVLMCPDVSGCAPPHHTTVPATSSAAPSCTHTTRARSNDHHHHHPHPHRGCREEAWTLPAICWHRLPSAPITPTPTPAPTEETTHTHSC